MASNSNHDDECPICLDNADNGEEGECVRCVSSGAHKYHLTCLNTVIHQGVLNAVLEEKYCPLCASLRDFVNCEPPEVDEPPESEPNTYTRPYRQGSIDNKPFWPYHSRTGNHSKRNMDKRLENKLTPRRLTDKLPIRRLTGKRIHKRLKGGLGCKHRRSSKRKHGSRRRNGSRRRF
jgi:hypothetical protein